MRVSDAIAPLLENDQLAAMDRLVAKLGKKSSGPETFTSLLIQEFNEQSPDQDALFLLSSYREDNIRLITDVLGYRGITAHRMRGIVLEDGRRRQTLSSLIKVHNGLNWVVFDPLTATLGLPDNFFIW